VVLTLDRLESEARAVLDGRGDAAQLASTALALVAELRRDAGGPYRSAWAAQVAGCPGPLVCHERLEDARAELHLALGRVIRDGASVDLERALAEVNAKLAAALAELDRRR